MEIVIEKNVPLTDHRLDRKQGTSKYKFEQMEDGDSFFVEDEPHIHRDKRRSRIWSTFRYWRNVTGFNGYIVTRRVKEGSREGLRVWLWKH
jgi:hypothetical protein